MLSKLFLNIAVKRTSTTVYYVRSTSIRKFSERKEDPTNSDPRNEVSKSEAKSERSEVDQRIEEEFANNKELQKMREELMNQLVVQKKKQSTEAKSAKELRDAILFDEILSKPAEVPLYDCRNVMFRWTYFGNMALILFATSVAIYVFLEEKYTRKWPYIVAATLFCLGRVKVYRDFQKHFVERVSYHTGTKLMTITKRRFFTGSRYENKIDKSELLYTEDPFLNKTGVNFINMKTLELYRIGYRYAWINQELFAHVISQRVKSIGK